jgi:hypothetical protein
MNKNAAYCRRRFLIELKLLLFPFQRCGTAGAEGARDGAGALS